MIRTLAVLAVALFVAGCNAKDLPPVNDLSAVCQALQDPIKYNSQNKLSKRYAAQLLALDLKQRNQLGERLHCPAFR